MDQLIRELQQVKDMSNVFTLFDVAFILCLSFVLSLVIAFVYRATHRGVSYSQSFVQTLVILSVTVGLVMLIIGSNIARAFALVGSLSIIRFRNAVKESRDVGFVFMAMAIGMACGTRFYLLAAFATVAFAAFVVIMYKFNLFAMEIRERILRVRLPSNLDTAIFEEVFRRYLKSYSIISIETVSAGTLQEIVYTIVMKAATKPEELLDSIRGLNGNNKVTLIVGMQEIDL